MKVRNIIIWSLILWPFSTSAFSQANKIKTTNSSSTIIFDTVSYSGTLFKDDFPIKITLISDFKKFIKTKYDDKYIPARMIVHLQCNDSIVKEIRIKTRGKSRKKHCYFPPIKLNFKTAPINDPEYEGINKMKMVTHCQKSKRYNNNTLKEYLTYKIYNALTDTSFRVRLLMVDYVDTGKKGVQQSRYGFVIEPLKALAKRFNAEPKVIGGVFYKDLDQFAADRVALFNYMIGNSDYRFEGGHNIKFLIKNKGILYPVPSLIR